MMFARSEETRRDLFEASVASVAFVVWDPCTGFGQVPRSFRFRSTRQIGEQTSHGVSRQGNGNVYSLSFM